MMKTVGELKKYLENVPNNTPLRGELQGLPNFDWGIFLISAEEVEDDENYDGDTLIISMDM